MDMISSRIRGTALIEGNEHIGYDELRRRIHSFARLIPTGDNQRVALVAENRSEWVYAFYAAWYRKAVTVPMDYLSTVGELAYMFADCRPEVVFCSRKTEKAVREAAGEKGLLPKILVFEELSPAICRFGARFRTRFRFPTTGGDHLYFRYHRQSQGCGTHF